MTAAQLLTSNKDDWETPGAFWARLMAEFKFDLDAAAHEMNAKLARFLTEDDDALNNPWPKECKRPFINPPYGKGNKVGKWMESIAREGQKPYREHTVALVAARTDTAWFHEIVLPVADEVRFVKGRLLFEVDGKPVQKRDKKGVLRDMPATFPSMVIVFRPRPVMRFEDAPLFTSTPARIAA